MFRTAFLLGGICVILGAFGAHSLKGILDAGQLANFETGVRYAMYHALALAAAGYAADKWPGGVWKWVFRFWLAGIICFSGSLFLLSSREVLGIAHWTWLGPVTALGGSFLIVGWLAAFVHVLK